MKTIRCAKGHFFDADKNKFCPFCGSAASGENKNIENDKPEPINMVMGMMQPPEPILSGIMIDFDKFISEDPIETKNLNGWESIHRLASEELKKAGNKECIFKCDCMVDVTNFDAKDPTDSLGYACSANILVFSDGMIVVIGDGEEERFHISSIVSYNDNIGNYNPSHEREVKFILADRAIAIGFYDKDKSAKKELTDKVKQLFLEKKK